MRLNRYGASPFWRAERTESPISRTASRCSGARGEIAPWEEESFAPDSWRALFTGHGIVPETWLPIIDRTSPDVMRANFRRMLGFVKEQVLRQSEHDSYLEQLHG
jgi:tryptophan halogenase